MRKQLTEAMIEKLAPSKAGRVEIFDTVVPALAVRLSTSGAKTFVVRARIRGQSAPVRITVGDARGMKLAAARQAASELLRACRAGVDPRPSKEPAAPATSDRLLWENVVDSFIEKHAKKNKTGDETRLLLAGRVTPAWRGKLIAEVTRADVVSLLDDVEETSVYRANRVLAAIRKLFNWAMLRGLVDSTPIVPGMAREGEVARTRYLTFDEIRLVWLAAHRIGAPFGPLVKFLLVTIQRRGEVASAQWPSLDLDEEKLWSLTSEETKAARAHLVPLTDLALSILRAQPLIDDPDLAAEAVAQGRNTPPAVWVFTTTGRSPLSGFGKAKEAIDAEVLAIMREEATASGKDPEAVKPLPYWRFHDLRRTGATHLEDALGVPPHIVGSVLNHAPGGYKGVTAVYTRGTLIYERRRALVAWARLLQLAAAGGATWATAAKILRPETEADAARTEEFRRMAQADEASWFAYLARISGQPEAKAA